MGRWAFTIQASTATSSLMAIRLDGFHAGIHSNREDTDTDMTIGNKRNIRRAGVIIGACLSAALLIALAYAIRIHTSAEALVASARRIQSAVDARREIQYWQNRSDRRFVEEQSADGEEQSYTFQVENVRLARLHLVQPTVVEMVISFHHGSLRAITVVMFSGR